MPTITSHKQWLLFLHGCLQSPCKSIRILPNFFIHLFLNHSIETRRTILIQHLICLQHSRRIKIIEIRVQLLIRYRYNWRKEINTNNPRKQRQIIDGTSSRNQSLISFFNRFKRSYITLSIANIDRILPAITITRNSKWTSITSILNTTNARTETAICTGQTIWMTFLFCILRIQIVTYFYTFKGRS